MRLAWYATGSTALAAAVVASAFHQRANFYSAMVHLAQSSLSLLALANLVFVVYGSLMYGLQRLCFGPLRPVEIEQLYEKAWFAVTETCLAMTIFREEVGTFFLVMFTALVTGKVWGWIGEGRVEVFEQQPPANPRLFHTRLSISLLLSVIYNTWFLTYAVKTVVQQARPTMMVMFLFEFAVLSVCSFQTGFRYIVSLVEQQVVKSQTRQRLEDRRRHIREQRADILRRREAGEAAAESEELPNEDDVDEMDIEVPGWEAKGLWVLSLDLVADFVKLGLYTTFFFVLFTFYGLPIHIIRDWFMTTRSFLKRLTALIRYRQALKDMDQYADATPEDLGQEDTCIICREEMRPWDPADTTQVERTRAKKLPCGHILHFGCLKSWLERQQVCPTCRRSVVREAQQPARNGEAMVFRLGLNFPAGQNQQPQPQANGQAPGGQPAQGAAPNNQDNNQNAGVRMFNLGPLRLGFAQGGVNDIQEMAQRLGMPADAVNPPATPAATTHHVTINPSLSLDEIRAQLLDESQRVQQELQALHSTAHELQSLNSMVNELSRIRHSYQVQVPLQQQQQQQSQGQQQPPQGQQQAVLTPTLGWQNGPGQTQFPPLIQQYLPPFVGPMFNQQPGQFPMMAPMQPLHPFHPRAVPTVTRHGGAGYGTAIPAGSPELPEGVVIPPGWSLLPLQRLDGGPPPLIDSSASNAQVTPNALQDMLNSLAPPAQTGTRPNQSHSSTTTAHGSERSDIFSNVATQGPEQSDISAPSIVAESSSLAQPSDAEVSQHPHQPTVTPVTAPTPITPNWGGSSQLFGGQNSTGHMFGYQREVTPTPQDGPAEGSSERLAPSASASSAARESSSGSTLEEAEQDNSTRDTGRARAAAVEDADDDEED
ncbi:hypothetical protein B0T17DRAFT_517007 [Bombardia bombarda]|uniref:RING-type E3 ubiquitin transferase n=1 Tax=Bombardia bombarda TaxID=252184 RepID=A0AA39XMH1_9PEZI|nr:hypothetical protein B0T17DRAFT_517007 [Bombardia bombarda]